MKRGIQKKKATPATVNGDYTGLIVDLIDKQQWSSRSHEGKESRFVLIGGTCLGWRKPLTRLLMARSEW